jgi:hypothetical protein
MTKEFIYEIEEYSTDSRHYQIISSVKLTHDEIRSVYQNLYLDENEENITYLKDKRKTVDKLEGYVDWSDERFTDNQILNEIKISGNYLGTEYGDDSHVGISGDIEGEE